MADSTQAALSFAKRNRRNGSATRWESQTAGLMLDRAGPLLRCRQAASSRCFTPSRSAALVPGRTSRSTGRNKLQHLWDGDARATAFAPVEPNSFGAATSEFSTPSIQHQGDTEPHERSGIELHDHVGHSIAVALQQMDGGSSRYRSGSSGIPARRRTARIAPQGLGGRSLDGAGTGERIRRIADARAP